MPRYRFTDRMDLIEEPSPKPVARSQDNVQHLHIWLDPPRIRDAANAPAEPGPTQGPDSELGEHLCTIRQDGRTGEWLGEDAEGNPVPAEAAGSPVGAGYDSPPSSISNLAEIGVPCASLALSPPCKVAVAFFIAAANADELPSSARALAPTALERPIVATSTMTGTALDVIVSLLTRDMVPRSLVRVL